jgi:hypothetical protein
MIERLGFDVRAIARRGAEATLLAGLSQVRLVDLDDLLSGDRAHSFSLDSVCPRCAKR